jgi:hypothetical protein
MKKPTQLFTTLLFCIITTYNFSQNNVGIGTTTPNASSALDIVANDKGILVPRMTSTQRTAIASPANALLVYDTDVNCFYYFVTATGWQNMCAGTAGPAGTPGATGPQGPTGASGATGPQGPTGAAGAIGPAGTPGAAGANGANGVDGIDGAAGTPGAAGAVGPVGPVGPAGANGVDGIDGAAGTPGAAGAAGPQGPAGATGAAGTPGAVGAAGPQGPAGVNGVTNMNGVTLTTSRTINTAAWTAVAGMSFTFTATTTSAIVMFSASGYGYTNSMAFVQFRIRNGATVLGSTQTKIQSYDDVTGTITPWSCTYTRYITGLTVGAVYTIAVDGQRGGIFGTYDAIVDPTASGHHMSVSVIQ